ncbi:unnamed protein product [Musa textilis]
MYFETAPLISATVLSPSSTLRWLLVSLSIRGALGMPCVSFGIQVFCSADESVGRDLSYLIYDLICCLFDKIPRMDNSVHHIVGIVGITAGLAYGMCGSEMVAAMWLTEISSPFLHMRELLKELGYRDTNLTLAFDILFAAIFSLARMVGGPYLTYVTLTADYPLLIKAMALGLQLVSAFWFYKILRMVRYKVAKRMAPNKSIKISVH